jgi:hypothetical protein
MNRLIYSSPDSYLLGGQAIEFLRGRVFDAEPGAYLLTGQAASALLDRILASDSAAYGLAGADIEFLRGRILDSGPGLYVLAGQDITIAWTAAFVVPIILRVDGRAFVKDIEKRIKVKRLEPSKRLLDVEKRR